MIVATISNSHRLQINNKSLSIKLRMASVAYVFDSWIEKKETKSVDLHSR